MTPAPDEHQVELRDELLTALRHDAYVRFDLAPGSLERTSVTAGVAVAWVGAHRAGVRWATALALDPHDPEHVHEAVRLLVPLARAAEAAGTPANGITITRGGRDLLPADLRQIEAWEWDFWCTEIAPEPVETPYGIDASVVDLDEEDPRIGQLLDVSSPTASLRPGDPRVVRWAGIEDPEGGLSDTGGLAAVLAVTRQPSGAAHLNDVATHPARRGRALARLLCGEATTAALRAGAPAVTLGMYADNDAARRVYSSLGFVCVRGQTSGRIRTAD